MLAGASAIASASALAITSSAVGGSGGGVVDPVARIHPAAATIDTIGRSTTTQSHRPRDRTGTGDWDGAIGASWLVLLARSSRTRSSLRRAGGGSTHGESIRRNEVDIGSACGSA